MEQTTLYVSILHQSLERKKEYLNKLLQLTKKQAEIAGEKDFNEDAFEDVINEKDILINNINEIDKGFTSVYDRVRTEVLDNQDVYKKELLAIQELIRECVDFGMEIEATEKRNKALFEQVFARGFKGIKQVKQSKQVANRYYQSMSNGAVNDSILYDRKK
ncbi:MAG: hypothetical protein PUG10_00115 [Lachnospiraceae bacterium]|nr:hypothetical protein [Lachnospiraceae bacterium]